MKKNIMFLSPVNALGCLLFLLLSLCPGDVHAADDDIAVLRRQLEEQHSLIQEQSELVKVQQLKIERQTLDLEQVIRRLDENATGTDATAHRQAAPSQMPVVDSSKAAASPVNVRVRDGVGDLNSESIKSGDFPGSFKIHGPGNISLAIGGFIKTVAIEDSDLGWGGALTGHLNLFERDRLRFGGTYGKGLGRYLLGIQSIDGGAVDPATDELKLRDNWGGFASYEHHWSDKFRSSAMLGYV